MGDLIDRQAAIDIIYRSTVDTNPDHFDAHQKFIQFLDSADISSFGRWQWSNGFNTALTAMSIDVKNLPSAQSDIVHCGECKYQDKGWNEVDEWNQCGLRPWLYIPVHDEHYCSWGERREK